MGFQLVQIGRPNELLTVKTSVLLFNFLGRMKFWRGQLDSTSTDSSPKKLSPFFFSGTAGWSLTARVIRRIALEISESSFMSEVAVFCIRRSAT
jgi:hypothetical protein